MAEVYRYQFSPAVPVEEAQASLLLALLAIEALHGAAAVLLDVAHEFDVHGRTCWIDASTGVGRELSRVYCGLLRREFGEGGFTVERVKAKAVSAPTLS